METARADLAAEGVGYLDIRERARTEAQRRTIDPNMDDPLPGDHHTEGWRLGFKWGAQWSVGQLPDAEEIAAVLRHHNFGDNLLGNITWDMWMAKCDCGWESPEFRYPGESSDAYYAHAAGAVLALVGERLQAK